MSELVALAEKPHCVAVSYFSCDCGKCFAVATRGRSVSLPQGLRVTSYRTEGLEGLKVRWHLKSEQKEELWYSVSVCLFFLFVQSGLVVHGVVWPLFREGLPSIAKHL